MFSVITGGGRKATAGSGDGPKPVLVASVDTPDAYRAVLRTRFAEVEETAGATLQAGLRLLPEPTCELHIGIHLSQDGDGSFDIILHAIGPDHYVLNKAIKAHRTLFEGRTFAFEDKLASLPGFDIESPPFDVAGVLVDESVVWVAGLWQRFGPQDFARPVEVFAEDGWTELLRGPERLHEGAE